MIETMNDSREWAKLRTYLTNYLLAQDMLADARSILEDNQADVFLVFRERHNWTQAQFADALDVTNTYISHVEHNRVLPSIETVRKVVELDLRFASNEKE
jgi:DNA-binding XRE family transcriptional regulator